MLQQQLRLCLAKVLDLVVFAVQVTKDFDDSALDLQLRFLSH